MSEGRKRGRGGERKRGEREREEGEREGGKEIFYFNVPSMGHLRTNHTQNSFAAVQNTSH